MQFITLQGQIMRTLGNAVLELVTAMFDFLEQTCIGNRYRYLSRESDQDIQMSIIEFVGHITLHADHAQHPITIGHRYGDQGLGLWRIADMYRDALEFTFITLPVADESRFVVGDHP